MFVSFLVARRTINKTALVNLLCGINNTEGKCVLRGNHIVHLSCLHRHVLHAYGPYAGMPLRTLHIQVVWVKC